MKIVIIGGTGLIGTRLGNILTAAGHQVTAASPSRGVNAVTGEGLDRALAGADILVDVANSPSFEDAAVLAFFEASTRNLIAAATATGIRHYVALSVVGADRLPDSGYMRAKRVQERLIEAAALPYTILRATQFFEFMAAIAWTGGEGDELRLASQMMQPIAATDVVTALADVVIAPPANATLEIAGAQTAPLAEFVGRWLEAQGDRRRVIADPQATYFGAQLDERSLVPLGNARIMPTRFDAWLRVREPVQ